MNSAMLGAAGVGTIQLGTAAAATLTGTSPAAVGGAQVGIAQAGGAIVASGASAPPFPVAAAFAATAFPAAAFRAPVSAAFPATASPGAQFHPLVSRPFAASAEARSIFRATGGTAQVYTSCGIAGRAQVGECQVGGGTAAPALAATPLAFVVTAAGQMALAQPAVRIPWIATGGRPQATFRGNLGAVAIRFTAAPAAAFGYIADAYTSFPFECTQDAVAYFICLLDVSIPGGNFAGASAPRLNWFPKIGQPFQDITGPDIPNGRGAPNYVF